VILDGRQLVRGQLVVDAPQTKEPRIQRGLLEHPISRVARVVAKVDRLAEPATDKLGIA
jgi:hypothetical protein